MNAEIEEFFDIYWPEDPRTLINQKIEVPLPYIVSWLQTYGTNNWRRRNGLPMLRRGLEI